MPLSEGIDPEVRAGLSGARRALEVLVRNLGSIGFPLQRDPLPRMVPADLELLREAELPIPPMLLALWEELGGVALVDCRQYRHVEFLARMELRGRAEFCDGLWIDVPGELGWVEHVIGGWDDWQTAPWSDDPDFVIELSPDGYHKDDISGGEPYGVAARADGDSTLLRFDWPSVWTPPTAQHPPDLLSYVRTSVLDCAGFPGLYGQRDFEEMRVRLLEGVSAF